MQRLKGLLLGGMVAALALLTVGSGAAAAKTEFVVFRNLATNSCLAYVSGVGVTQGVCAADPDKTGIAQRWDMEYGGAASGGYTIKSVASGQCLVGSSMPIGRGDRVAMLPCRGNGHKLWSSSGAPYQAAGVFRNLAGYAQPMCLDDTHRFGVTLQPCTPGQENSYEAWVATLAAS